MGGSPEVITSGGGAAGPVGEDFAGFLQGILGGGGPTRDPTGQTTDIMRALNELIAGPDVRGQQSAIQQTIQQSSERQVADLRERFTSGGGSRGTPSAVAEGLFRSEVTPRIATAVGDLELRANQQRIQALLPFLQILAGFAGRGIPQAGTDVTINPGWLETAAGLGVAGSEIFGNIRGNNSAGFQDPRNWRP
ncbi:hypothetical protein LCGC14_0908920 [marine sediment metagenome]|uniref:Uncharacterized protein n=1 Tax=marine sediment metagenome TaxID=412755 RepID=A0A0F9NYV7_9ZZZZ